MSDDDGSEQLFEGQVEVSSLERGATFGLDEETYFRMATLAITAGGLHIEPCTDLQAPQRRARLQTDPLREDPRVRPHRARLALRGDDRGLRRATRQAALRDPALRGPGLRRSLVARAPLDVRCRVDRILRPVLGSGAGRRGRQRGGVSGSPASGLRD